MGAQLALDPIKFMVGTTALAPAIVPVGTLITAPITGAIEHDGTSFYSTPDTAAVSGRAVSEDSHLVCQSATGALASQNTVQKIFATPTTGALTVAAGTTYLIDALILLNCGTVTHTTAFGFGGTASITSVMFETEFINAVAGTLVTPQSARFITIAGGVMNATSILASGHFRVKGVVRINAGGTLIPQITFSSAPTGTNTVGINSFLKLTPIGSGTVNQIGAWA